MPGAATTARALQLRVGADPERFVRRPGRALVLGAGFLVLFALGAILVPVAPIAIERGWAGWMHDVETPVLTHVALVFNFLGRGTGRILVLGALALVLLAARRWEALLAFALAEAVTPFASALVKALVDRPRPPDGLVHPAGASFPSGHAAFAGATCVAAVLLFTRAGPGRARWWTLALAGTAVMAWSRTYLQVHWLLDVVAGSLLGAGVSLAAFAAVQLVWPARKVVES